MFITHRKKKTVQAELGQVAKAKFDENRVKMYAEPILIFLLSLLLFSAAHETALFNNYSVIAGFLVLGSLALFFKGQVRWLQMRNKILDMYDGQIEGEYWNNFGKESGGEQKAEYKGFSLAGIRAEGAEEKKSLQQMYAGLNLQLQQFLKQQKE